MKTHYTIIKITNENHIKFILDFYEYSYNNINNYLELTCISIYMNKIFGLSYTSNPTILNDSLKNSNIYTYDLIDSNQFIRKIKLNKLYLK